MRHLAAAMLLVGISGSVGCSGGGREFAEAAGQGGAGASSAGLGNGGSVVDEAGRAGSGEGSAADHGGSAAAHGGAHANGGTAQAMGGSASTSGGAAAGVGGAQATSGGAFSGGVGSNAGDNRGGTSSGGASGGTGGSANAGGTGGGGSVNGSGGAAQGTPTCGSELLANPDFEQGSSGWVAESNWPGADQFVVAADAPVLKTESVTPYSGAAVAWLGGIPDSSSSHHITVTQSIELPADATSLTLSGYILIHTDEPDSDNTFDAAFIEIILASGEDETVLFVTDPFWTPRDASSSWKAFERVIEVAEWKQRQLLFRITSNSDDGYKTHFWFDKLALTASCGRG